MRLIEDIEEMCFKHLAYDNYNISRKFLVKMHTEIEGILRDNLTATIYQATNDIRKDSKVTKLLLANGIEIDIIIDDTIPPNFKFKLYHLKEVQ